MIDCEKPVVQKITIFVNVGQLIVKFGAATTHSIQCLCSVVSCAHPNQDSTLPLSMWDEDSVSTIVVVYLVVCGWGLPLDRDVG